MGWSIIRQVARSIAPVDGLPPRLAHGPPKKAVPTAGSMAGCSEPRGQPSPTVGIWTRSVLWRRLLPNVRAGMVVGLLEDLLADPVAFHVVPVDFHAKAVALRHGDATLSIDGAQTIRVAKVDWGLA